MSQEKPTNRESNAITKIQKNMNGALNVYSTLNKPAKVTVWVIFIATFTAIFAPIVAPHNPNAQNLDIIMEPPFSTQYILGTDPFGRDVLSRLIYGGRVSLFVGVGTVVLATSLGVPAGTIAAWSGGYIEETIMRVSDLIMAFPPLVLALALISAFGSSINTVILAFGIVYSPQYARLIRSSIISVKREDYVAAARTTGLKERYIMLRHVLPNSMTPVIVQASFHISAAMLGEAALSFLGLGVQPPTASWGLMIASGRTYIPGGWWLMLFPGIAIFIVATSFNYIGDTLRDKFDPHSVTEQRESN